MVEPVLSLVEKDSSWDQKLRVRSAPKTSKSKASRYAHLNTRASSLGTLSIRSKNVRLRLRVQRQQERSNSSSHRATPPKPSQGNTRRPNADKSSSKDASTQTILSHSSVASILQEKRLKNLQKMAEKACSQCLNLRYNIRIKIELLSRSHRRAEVDVVFLLHPTLHISIQLLPRHFNHLPLALVQ